MIYLVRHGDAVPEQVDPSRPLSPKGRAEVEATARALLKDGAKIDEIWHSTKLRAKQTAEIIGQILGVKKILEKKGLKPYDPATPIAKKFKTTHKSILIASHLPFIPKLVLLLKPEMGEIELKTGRVVVV